MKYGSEDFEQLKKTVGDFFQNGPLGDIRVYWYMMIVSIVFRKIRS